MPPRDDGDDAKRRPVAVDLFAGAGGMSLGFERAGFDIACAVEADPIHAAVHLRNFPRTPVLCRSVVGLAGGEILAAAGEAARGGIDCLFGGPPCQGFSTMGRRAADDPRNALVFEFVRLAAEMRPRRLVMENVPGMLSGTGRAVLDEAVARLAAAGYEVSLPARALDASLFGVAQRRRRVFLLAARAGEPLPQYPDPPGGPVPSAADVLDDLPDADGFAELLDGDEVSTPLGEAASEAARLLRDPWSDPADLSARRRFDPGLLTCSARTQHASGSAARFAAAPCGLVEPVTRFLRLHPGRPANTLRAGTGADRGAFTAPRPIHHRHARVVTVREAMRLHGFPDWFRVHRTKWHGFREVGNAVPPPLAAAVASQVAASLGLRPARPGGVLDPGDDRLLGMDMSAAAAFWGVPPPGGRRRGGEDGEVP